MIEPRKEVQIFAQLMELQLRKNDHKKGWRNDSPNDLLDRLRQETEELSAELSKAFDLTWWPRTTAPVWPSFSNHEWRSATEGERAKAITQAALEAADVANFAMMIVDQLNYAAHDGGEDG